MIVSYMLWRARQIFRAFAITRWRMVWTATWTSCLFAIFSVNASAFADERLIVFAAASLKGALDSAVAQYKSASGITVDISYGGSTILARQIIAGAPADLFASADEQSMDLAQNAKALRGETRFDFLRNRLVLIAPKSFVADRVALDDAGFARALGNGKLAVGETTTVPAGRYAKESLVSLGLWSAAEPHLAMTDNVRAALAFVAHDEATLGIVYSSDAASDPTVKIVAEFPEASHAPILYPVALTSNARNPAAERLLDFLKMPAARKAFEAAGFQVLP